MAQKKAVRDIVLFLGAGFSCDAGLPTMEGFGEESRYELSRLLKEKEQGKKAAPMLYDAGIVYRAFQEYCASTDLVGVNVENLETVFCIAEAMNQADVDPRLQVHTPESIASNEQENSTHSPYPSSDLMKQIQFWLWNIYQMCPSRDEKRVTERGVDPQFYEEFAAYLKEKGTSQRLTFITTNYDLIVEYYMWAVAEYGCKYPLTMDWDYVRLTAGDRPDLSLHRYLGPYDDIESRAWLVCKLHGSVNCFELAYPGHRRLGICDDVTHAGEWIGNSGIPSYTPRHKTKIRDINMCPAIFALDAIWSLREKYGNSLTPAIIPPTYAKLQGQPWLQRIWNSAFRALQEARYVVFIGYSMPASDEFMRAMFRAAFASRRDSGPEIYVINPGDEACKAYKELFPSCKTECEKRIIKLSFAKAWKQGRLQEILDEATGNQPA